MICAEVFRQMRELGFEWDGEGQDDSYGRFVNPEHPEYGIFTVQSAEARLAVSTVAPRNQKTPVF